METTEYIFPHHHFTLFYEDGQYWVDTGHADVGPFTTKQEARDHIQRIVDTHKQHTETLVSIATKAFF